MELKDFELKLAELKTALEEKAKGDVKAEVAEQLKAISDATAEAAKADVLDKEAKAVELKRISDELAITVKAFDRIQITLKDRRNSTPQSAKSFSDVIKIAMEDATDDIAKFQRKESKSVVIDLKAFDLKVVGDMSIANVTGGSLYGQWFTFCSLAR